MASTGPIQVEIRGEVSRPLKELLQEVLAEVQALRAELASHTCNHHHGGFNSTVFPLAVTATNRDGS